MRRFLAVFVATVAGLVILLSFKTTSAKPGPPVALSGTTPGSPNPASSPPASAAPGSTETNSEDSGTSAQSAAPSPSASASSAKPTPSAASTGTKTVMGAAVPASEGGRRMFGIVTVQLTVTNGRITAATVTTYPNNDAHSSEISSFAIPVLNSEVVAAQSAQINAVSGATITSNAYAQSLQAALDKLKA